MYHILTISQGGKSKWFGSGPNQLRVKPFILRKNV